MNDMRMELMRRLEEEFVEIIGTENINIVMDVLVKTLNEYEITERCTEVVKVDTPNENLIKRFSACLLVDGKSEKTIKQYVREIKNLTDFLNIPLKNIGTYDIRYYLACAKERGISSRTLENMRSYISTFYKWLFEEGIIKANPCCLIKPIKYTQKIRKPLSDIEINILRDNCKNSKERALVELLLSSGIRASELASLNINDIDFRNLSVYVKNGKGAKERITYITPITAVYLQKYLSERKCQSTALFTSNKCRLTDKGVQFIIRQLGQRSNIDNVHPHRFRRTFATNLANNGMNIQEIKKLLGHSNIQTTLEYVFIEEKKINESYKLYSIKQ